MELPPLPEPSPPPLPPLTRPPALVRGDCIGVVAPSYAPRPGWLARGVRALERAGFGVIMDSEIEVSRRFMRLEDERRAENFMGMWLDPRVKAVIGGTGGYGAVRMLPHLDPEVFRLNPKAFVGYSDMTALHLWLMRLAGLRVFHGPTVDDLVPGSRDPTMLSLLSALTTPRPATRIGRDIARSVRPGRAVGRLIGGNLSLVQQTIGTPYEVDTRDAILFIEETRDPMSVADERILHLRAAGLLGQVRGIVFGQLSLDRSEEDEFEDFLLDLVAELNVPILMDFPAGHEIPNLTLPIGTEVELVAEEVTGWITYREDALLGLEDAAAGAGSGASGAESGSGAGVRAGSNGSSGPARVAVTAAPALESRPGAAESSAHAETAVERVATGVSDETAPAEAAR